MSDTHYAEELIARADDEKNAENWLAAARLYAQALLVDRAATGLWVQYGHMLKEAECFAHAVTAYQSGVRSDGTAVEPRLHLAHLLKRLGRSGDAMAAFRALALLPDSPPVKHEMRAIKAAAEQSAKRMQPPLMDRPLEDEDARLFAELSRMEELDQNAISALNTQSAASPNTTSFSATITPQAHLIIRDDSFVATTRDPQFAVLLEVGDFFEGWYRCEIEIEASVPVVEPLLYVEWTANWSEFSVHRFAPVRKNFYRATFYLDRTARRMRLDPFTGEGPFLVPQFSLRRLSWRDALALVPAGREGLESRVAALIKRSPRKIGRALSRALAPPAMSPYARWMLQHEQIPSRQKRMASPEFDVVILPENSSPAADVTLGSLKSDQAWRAVSTKDGPTQAGSSFVLVIAAGHSIAAGACAHIAEALTDDPSIDVLYGDDDERDASGLREHPNFKPDWNPDYFYAANYIGETFVMRRTLLEELLGQRRELSSSDLLRAALVGKTGRRVRHIPVILSHRPARSRKAAAGGGMPTLWSEQDQRALATSLSAMHPGIALSRAEHGLLHLAWPLPATPPRVSLMIPTRDHVDLLRDCIQSIRTKTDYPDIEFVVVDNGSTDGEALAYLEELRQTPGCTVLDAPGPFNFSRLNNLAVEAATGDVVGLVNNDVIALESNWLREMVGHALRPDVGAVGARLLYQSGAIQHAGMICGLGLLTGHPHKFLRPGNGGYMGRVMATQTLTAVTGACLIVEKAKYLAVGGLDEDHLPVAFNDVDFCLKLTQAGYRTIYTPYALLYHLESISRGFDTTNAKAESYRQEAEFMRGKWGDRVTRDPYYNPNLTREREDFSIAD